MFKLLGLVLAVYVVFAAVTGQVLVKAGMGGRRVHRDESPEYFWVCIVIYAGLAVALMTLF